MTRKVEPTGRQASMRRWGAKAQQDSGEISSLRIAVADDEERMRQFYTAVLNRLGHRVVGAAADGQQLVDICLREPVDFVITDIKMPTMSGVDAARAITERIPLPFLFVSAYHDDELIAGASMRFGYGYLVKPIKQEDLSTSIPIAVRRFRVQES